MQAQRIVVVGGVAGGATAAAKARRTSESAEITLFERGAHISFANCGLPYFIAGEISDRDKLLLSTPEAFAARYRIQVNTGHEVVTLLRREQRVRVRNTQGQLMEVPYDRLILAQGAEPIVPELPGVDLPHVFTLRNLSDMDQIMDFL
ncbi:MAG: FAD/NAD(P)-binding oxidoreductase, partial [Candidatus Sericytochromatia bacterium]